MLTVLRYFAGACFAGLGLSACAIFGTDEQQAEWLVMREVKAVNDARFTYITDQQKYGVPEFWNLNETGDQPFSGDCEEYAIAAQHQLLKRGVWSRIVIRPGHAIVCGRFYCIDNNKPWVFKNEF